MKNIATALVNAKKSFDPAIKNSTNPHFRSKYADLAACIEAVDTALLENGVFLYQETFEDSSGVTVETVFLHESGESIRCGKLHVPASKNDPQGYGSALSYARRYSLMSACGIAPEDDDGQAASQQQRQQPPARQHQPSQNAKLSANQITEITNLINETNSDFSAFMEWVSAGVKAECNALKDVPATAYDVIVNKLKSKLKPQ